MRKFGWSEPWLFLLRIRTFGGWLRRLGLTFVPSAAIAIVLLVNGRDPLEGVGLGFGTWFLLMLLLDKSSIQRDVNVYPDSVLVSSSIGLGWHEDIAFSDIRGVSLFRHGEWEFPGSGVVFHRDDDGYVVGLPAKMPIETVANVLDRLMREQSIEVRLSDWAPSEGDHRVQVEDELPLDREPLGAIQVLELEPSEGPLVPPMQVAIQVCIAFLPFLVALGFGGWAGWRVWSDWSNLGLVERATWIGLPIVGLVLTFLFAIWIGQFAAAAYGIGIGRRRLESRPASLVNSRDEALLPVEMFDREKWTQTVCMSRDYGFLDINASGDRFLFEGNKGRWELPISAITRCRVEEANVTGGDGKPIETRYYVNLAAACVDGPWETGLTWVRTDMGRDGNVQRRERARSLFTLLAERIAL